MTDQPGSRAASVVTALALALGMSACSAEMSSVASDGSSRAATPSPVTRPASPAAAPSSAGSPAAGSAAPSTPAATAKATTQSPSADTEPTDGDPQVNATRVYFGHQSVGYNVLKGINLISETSPAGRPDYVNLAEGEPLPDGGFFAHAKIGRNGQPDEKLADFADTLRTGLAAQVDVAVMKFCYLDIRANTDVDQIFDEYRSAFRTLEKEFPDVTFIYATVPLQSHRPSDNVARTRFNSLIRKEYADTGRLWDIARAESTEPDGDRVRGSHNGQQYEAMFGGYTEDGGHLNEKGATAAAAPLIELITQT